MPDRLGSSVVVISSARAQRRHRIMATWAWGRVIESMLCRTVDPELDEFEDGRSKSEDAEEEDDEDDEDDVPV